MKVVFAPSVENDLLNLIDILVDEGYISTYPFAIRFVDDLIDYIDNHIAVRLHKKAPKYFSRYGKDLKYMTYNNSQTTWYILFEEHVNCYYVKYITNNKYEGHFFVV